MEPDERRKVSLMQALATIRNEKVAIRKESAQRRKEVRAVLVSLAEGGAIFVSFVGGLYPAVRL